MTENPYAPTRWSRALVIECIAVAVIALAAIAIASHLRSTYYNNYVRLADAVLHGHLWIDWPGRTIDAAEFNGQHYVIDGPFPTLLVWPLVIFSGATANQTLVAIVMGTLATILGWYLGVRLGVARGPRLWLTAFLFAGTDLWWCSELGDVWFLAHVVAVAFTFLALLELLGRQRGWLVALYAIAATESRFTLVLALPFYAYVLAGGGWYGLRNAVDWRKLRGYGGVLAGGVALWIGYNELLWGLPYDIGHTLYFHQDSWGQKMGSPFRLSYLPYQLYSYFMRPPVLVEWLQQTQWPYLKVDPNGVALTFTSPALILVFFSKAPVHLKRALWATTVLVAGPDFLYYLNGWYQFGMRHALDFEPFLLVLMAYAVRERMPRWGAALCAYSAFAGLWGVWYWNAFFRTGN
ncbi:MAG: hypothetical protein ACREM6_12525 [Vulcanimicrobiaceae bacterium]